MTSRAFEAAPGGSARHLISLVFVLTEVVILPSPTGCTAACLVLTLTFGDRWLCTSAFTVSEVALVTQAGVSAKPIKARTATVIRPKPSHSAALRLRVTVAIRAPRRVTVGIKLATSALATGLVQLLVVFAIVSKPPLSPNSQALVGKIALALRGATAATTAD